MMLAEGVVQGECPALAQQEAETVIQRLGDGV